jgi:predicted dehydrogenase
VPWRGKWKTELGGVLMGHAIHPHDILVYLMGDIETRVFGRVATRVNPISKSRIALLASRSSWRSGALGSFTATLGARPTRSAAFAWPLRMSPSRAITQPYNPGD